MSANTPTEEQRLKRNAYMREWSKKNRPRLFEQRMAKPERRQELIEVSKQWKKDNPERTKELKRLSYARHKERICAENRVENLTPEQIEKRRERARERYQANKEQIREKEKARRAANKEAITARNREYRAAHRAEHHLYDTKKRANKLGIECTLTPEWIRERFEKGVCELTGVAFDMEGKRTPNSPSIDRIDPVGGYTPENCEMILWSLNRAFCNYGRSYIIDLFRKIVERDQ